MNNQQELTVSFSHVLIDPDGQTWYAPGSVEDEEGDEEYRRRDVIATRLALLVRKTPVLEGQTPAVRNGFDPRKVAEMKQCLALFAVDRSEPCPSALTKNAALHELKPELLTLLMRGKASPAQLCSTLLGTLGLVIDESALCEFVFGPHE